MLDDGKRRTRLAAFRPGVSFGEFALFDRGRRVANVVAETPVDLLRAQLPAAWSSLARSSLTSITVFCSRLAGF